MEDINTLEQTKKKNKKAVWRRLVLVLIGLLLGVNIYLANARGIMGNQMPMPFGYGMANVLSGSMEPTFSKGTLLLVKETDDVSVGDIVVYQAEHELVVHRVTAIDGDTVITRGDANNADDAPFDRSEIKGKVIGWIPYMGSIVNILKTPTGLILMICCGFFLVEGSFRKQQESDDRELEAIKEEIRRLKQEKEKNEDN